jgi:hypothetical protein|tara:strand:+ start:661 stop:1413 length:753 start_codon:yes stop_codon:yes gene_type:complete
LITTRKIAISSAFAVIYMILRFVQTIPVVGIAGAAFSLSDAIAPIYGIILGPYIGSASIILGTGLTLVFGKPTYFAGLDFLPAAMNAFTIGLLIKRKRGYASMLFLITLIAFLIHPLTSQVIMVNFPFGKIPIPFNWLHLAALLLLISPLSMKAVEWIEKGSIERITISVFMLTFIGTMIQHAVGGLLTVNIAWMYLGKIPTQGVEYVWNIVFYLYPIERITLALIATIIGVPILKTIKGNKLGINLKET